MTDGSVRAGSGGIGPWRVLAEGPSVDEGPLAPWACCVTDGGSECQSQGVTSVPGGVLTWGNRPHLREPPIGLASSGTYILHSCPPATCKDRPTSPIPKSRVPLGTLGDRQTGSTVVTSRDNEHVLCLRQARPCAKYFTT